MSKKIYAYGMDGFIVPMMKKFVAEGCLPNFEKMLKSGTVNQNFSILSSLDADELGHPFYRRSHRDAWCHPLACGGCPRRADRQFRWARPEC